jgi:predicted DsbA family dithiol-disulfide isomerase
MTTLDIVSDPICPWCYLGAANLLHALAGREPFAIRWRPYQLDPEIPPEGIDRATYLRQKLGGNRLDAIHARLGAMGADVGIAYRFDRIARTPSTLDAHRLIRWAGERQTGMAMELFRRYFELGEDISAPPVLAAAAAAASLDPDIAPLLAGDTDRAAVQAEADEARRMGITGVPTFLIGGRYLLTGAQPPDTWRRLAAELDAATPPG